MPSDPTILRGDDYFAAKTRSGTGANGSVTGLRFQPDLVWNKSRDEGTGSYTGDHKIWDAVRGVTKSLESNTQDNEATEGTGLTAFNSDGFDFGALNQINFSGDLFIDWCWKEGALPGFDIVAYSGTGSAHAENHNLGVVPAMMLVKARNPSSAENWRVYHKDMDASPATVKMQLNDSNAATASSGMWNDTAPTSTQFTVGTDSSVNENTRNHIAYLFADVPGFSKFGGYAGNNNADGPFVWCGFRPALVIVKRATGGTGNWFMLDATRSAGNETDDHLLANSNSAEIVDGTNGIGIFANGFKLRNSSNGMNTSSSTYVFAAFAEAPFKYARAR
jgi:hypothetical protein